MNENMYHPYATMTEMVTSTSTTGGFKVVRIYGKREAELQATRESLERDLKELAETHWFQLSKRSCLKEFIIWKAEHLADTLRNYKEGEVIK